MAIEEAAMIWTKADRSGSHGVVPAASSRLTPDPGPRPASARRGGRCHQVRAIRTVEHALQLVRIPLPLLASHSRSLLLPRVRPEPIPAQILAHARIAHLLRVVEHP